MGALCHRYASKYPGRINHQFSKSSCEISYIYYATAKLHTHTPRMKHNSENNKSGDAKNNQKVEKQTSTRRRKNAEYFHHKTHWAGDPKKLREAAILNAGV